MKISQKHKHSIIGFMALTAICLTATAQTKSLPKQEQEHILVASESSVEGDTKVETLSGINLLPAKNGTFVLDFSQELKEDAMLEMKDATGRVVFQKPVSIANRKTSWRYNVGKLNPSTYLIEIKTSDTTYWTKFKIGN